MNVSNFEKSVAFYELLFGTPPAKHHADYAKFELTNPPLVFSLVPNAPAAGGGLSHLGFPVASAEEVAAVGRRLEQAGLSPSCQQGTVCGYARQDKIWIADPDHNYWEIYVVHEDVSPETVRKSFDGMSPLAVDLPQRDACKETPESVFWEHRVLDAAVARIPHTDDSVDEVRLEGTFNSELNVDDRRNLLAESRRVLKPGGRVHVHGLVSDRPLNGQMPSLPGVAALVSACRTEAELLA